MFLGLTRSGLEPTIYPTRDEHTNQNTTDAVYKIVFYTSIKVQNNELN
jgi:hypothetical protein